jgi:hypothetical protein
VHNNLAAACVQIFGAIIAPTSVLFMLYALHLFNNLAGACLVRRTLAR